MASRQRQEHAKKAIQASSMKEASKSRSDGVLGAVAGLPGLLVGMHNPFAISVLGSTDILVTRYSFGRLVNAAGVVLDPEQIDGLMESA